MSETRLEKYKKYRESLNEVKENAKSDEMKEARRERLVTDTYNTTSTLPLEEVVGKLDEETDTTSDVIITRKRIKIAILIGVGVLLLAGIIVWAIIAFGGK